MNRLPFAVSADYREWNKRLLEYSLQNGVDEDGRFFLTVQEMLDDRPEGYEAAKESFLAAVRAAYSDALSYSSDPIATLCRGEDFQKRPMSVAFLSASVLASEESTGNAYYPALAIIMAQPQEGSGLHGFEHDSFERAWLSLNRWLRQHGLFLVQPEYDGKRYVRWPRMHCLLRATDVAELPFFFKLCGFSPLKETTERQIEIKFENWLRNPDGKYRISARGKTAWEDREVRRPGIIRQILRTLALWDGELPARNPLWDGYVKRDGFFRVPAGLVLEIDDNRHAVKIYLRVRRPQNRPDFPKTVSMGGVSGLALVTLTPADDHYFHDAPLPASWGRYLSEGIEAASGKNRVILRGREAFPFVKPEFGQFETAEALYAGQHGAVLCRRENASRIEGFLRLKCNLPPKRQELANALSEWILLFDFALTPSASGECCGVRIENRVMIRPLGGLRFGRAQEWMLGAAPHGVELVGGAVPETISVGTDSIAVVDRKADLTSVATAFLEPGAYTVWADRERYTFQVIAPEWRSPVQQDPERLFPGVATPNFSDDADAEFLLEDEPAPPTEINATCRFVGATPRRKAAPQWAIGLVEGLPSAIAQSATPSPPLSSRFIAALPLKSVEGWAAPILRLPTPRLGVVSAAVAGNTLGAEAATTIRVAWHSYQRAAHEALTQIRRERRRVRVRRAAKKEEI